MGPLIAACTGSSEQPNWSHLPLVFIFVFVFLNISGSRALDRISYLGKLIQIFENCNEVKQHTHWLTKSSSWSPACPHTLYTYMLFLVCLIHEHIYAPVSMITISFEWYGHCKFWGKGWSTLTELSNNKSVSSQALTHSTPVNLLPEMVRDWKG